MDFGSFFKKTVSNEEEESKKQCRSPRSPFSRHHDDMTASDRWFLLCDIFGVSGNDRADFVDLEVEMSLFQELNDKFKTAVFKGEKEKSDQLLEELNVVRETISTRQDDIRVIDQVYNMARQLSQHKFTVNDHLNHSISYFSGEKPALGSEVTKMLEGAQAESLEIERHVLTLDSLEFSRENPVHQTLKKMRKEMIRLIQRDFLGKLDVVVKSYKDVISTFERTTQECRNSRANHSSLLDQL